MRAGVIGDMRAVSHLAMKAEEVGGHAADSVSALWLRLFRENGLHQLLPELWPARASSRLSGANRHPTP